MYGKAVNGRLFEAPENIEIESEVNGVRMQTFLFAPTAEQYAKAGYLPVIEAEYPEGDGHYEKVYTERDGAIYGEWVEAAIIGGEDL